MKTVYLVLMPVLCVLTLSSCCGGSDQVIYNYAMEIMRASDTSQSKANMGFFYDQLDLIPLSRYEEGTRNCHLHNLVSEHRENIDTNSITVYCNRDIKSHGISFAAGENMLANQTQRLYNIQLKMDTADVEENIPYTYYVKGNTNLGNNFSDSVTVTYIK